MFQIGMRAVLSQQTVDVPQDVEFKVKGRDVIVKGKRGVLKKSFNHLHVQIEHCNKTGKVTVRKWFGSRKELAALRTICSHIKNLFKGVTYVGVLRGLSKLIFNDCRF